MPLHTQLIIALVTGLVVGVFVMVLLGDSAYAATALLEHRTSIGG